MIQQADTGRLVVCSTCDKLLHAYRQAVRLLQERVREWNCRLQVEPDKQFQETPAELLNALKAASKAQTSVERHQAEQHTVAEQMHAVRTSLAGDGEDGQQVTDH